MDSDKPLRLVSSFDETSTLWRELLATMFGSWDPAEQALERIFDHWERCK